MADLGTAMSKEERSKRSMGHMLDQIKMFHRLDYGGGDPEQVIEGRFIEDGTAERLVELSGLELVKEVARLCYEEAKRAQVGIAKRQDPWIDDLRTRVEEIGTRVGGAG